MRRYAAWVGGVVLGIGLMLATQHAQALIGKPPPLSDVLEGSQLILTAKVDTLDPDKPAMVLTADEDLKGKAPFRKLLVSLKGDSEAEKDKQTAKLLKRLAPGLPLVLFVNERGKNYITFAYTNGTWFQLLGARADDSDSVRWRFTHCEPYLRRTFKDSTADMRQTVADGLADKKKPPDPDPKVEPGLGPEVQAGDQPKPKEGGQVRATGGPPFAVIPSVLIAGPLAILALLFPTAFGGLALFFRRWMVVLTVISLTSTLFVLYEWLHLWVRDFWWGSPLALWVAMTLITLTGLLWAWRRHLAAVHEEAQAAAKAGDSAPVFSASVPRRGELIALLVLSLVGLVTVGLCLLWRAPLLDSSWRKPALILWLGVWAGALYTLYLRRRWSQATPGRDPVPAEGIMLAVMACGGTALGLTTLPRPAAAGDLTVSGDPVMDGAGLTGLAWQFQVTEEGAFYSSPLLVGDRVYIAAAHGRAFTYGRLYCLDRATGTKLWEFDNDGVMKQVFSTPCEADGRLYIGEGFHQDAGCHLFCLDADSGQKRWDFPTSSHTESSPCVAGGKVYFGAGDDGVFCLDAASGREVWHYEGLHVDCNPAVVGNRLYAGSGVGDLYRETCLLCLDAGTGEQIWRQPADLPLWGSPTVAGKHAFYGIGNGNFLTDDDNAPPAGALLCVEAATGRQVWRADVPNGVLNRPTVDRRCVYFGSRDGHCYCVDRSDGRQRWRYNLGGPVVAAVAQARSPGCGRATNVYAVGGSRVVCLDPDTGAPDWELDMVKEAQAQPRLCSSPAVSIQHEGGAELRRIFFGAGLSKDYRFHEAPVLFCYEDRYEDQ
jgi:outer membrane protein assembly factor BamB